jgi:tetratricopeptide (TPR) repeat protein
MRARQNLAESLREAGHLEEAIIEFEGMLKLNPNDNQGVRYNLLACYLAVNRLDGAGRLFAKYKECAFNTMFAWGFVLERFLVEDLVGAKKALAVARKQNSHTEAFLTGRRKPPKQLPDAYSPGSKEEAACFAEPLSEAWDHCPKALKWLEQQKK